MNCYLKLYDNMNMRKVLAAWAVALAVMCAAVGCVEERLTDDPSARLEFSCDTLVMDTLFAGVPSRTSRLMVYNRNDRALNISAVSLGGGELWVKHQSRDAQFKKGIQQHDGFHRVGALNDHRTPFFRQHVFFMQPLNGVFS